MTSAPFIQTSLWTKDKRIRDVQTFIAVSYDYWRHAGMWGAIQIKLIDFLNSFFIVVAVYVLLFLVNWDLLLNCDTEACISERPPDQRGILLPHGLLFFSTPSTSQEEKDDNKFHSSFQYSWFYTLLGGTLLVGCLAHTAWEGMRLIEKCLLQKEMQLVVGGFVRGGAHNPFKEFEGWFVKMKFVRSVVISVHNAISNRNKISSNWRKNIRRRLGRKGREAALDDDSATQTKQPTHQLKRAKGKTCQTRPATTVTTHQSNAIQRENGALDDPSISQTTLTTKSARNHDVVAPPFLGGRASENRLIESIITNRNNPITQGPTSSSNIATNNRLFASCVSSDPDEADYPQHQLAGTLIRLNNEDGKRKTATNGKKTRLNTNVQKRASSVACFSSYGIEVAGNDSDEEAVVSKRQERHRRRGYNALGSPTSTEMQYFPSAGGDGATTAIPISSPDDEEEVTLSDDGGDDDEDDPFILLDRAEAAEFDLKVEGNMHYSAGFVNVETDLSVPHIDDITWSDFLHRLCEALKADRTAIRNSPESFDELRAIQILMSSDNFMIALHQPRVRGGETSGVDEYSPTALEAAEEENQEGGIFHTSVKHHQETFEKRQQQNREEALERMMTQNTTHGKQFSGSDVGGQKSKRGEDDDMVLVSGNSSFVDMSQVKNKTPQIMSPVMPTAEGLPTPSAPQNTSHAKATNVRSSSKAVSDTVIIIDPPIIRRGALRYCDENILRYLISILLKNSHATPSSSAPADEQHQFLKERLLALAILCAAAYPFIVAVFTTRLLVKNIVEFRSRSQELVVSREWTPTAEWTFRLYNEVPHLAEARLRRGAAIARAIVDTSAPPRPIYRAIQRLASTVILLIVFITFVNASMLTIGVAFDRTLLWWLSTAIVVYSACTQPVRDREYSHLNDLKTFVKTIEYCNPVWLSSPSAFTDDITDTFLPPRLYNILANFLKISALPATLFYLWFVSDGEGSEISMLVRFVRDNSLWVEGVGTVARTSDFAGRWNAEKMGYQTGWGPMMESMTFMSEKDLASVSGDNCVTALDSARQQQRSSEEGNDMEKIFPTVDPKSSQLMPPPSLLSTMIHHFRQILHPKVPTELEKRSQQLLSYQSLRTKNEGKSKKRGDAATTYINMGSAYKSDWHFVDRQEGSHNQENKPGADTYSAIREIMGEHAAVSIPQQPYATKGDEGVSGINDQEGSSYPAPLITVTHEHTKSLKSLSYFAHCYDRWSLEEMMDEAQIKDSIAVARPSLGLTVRALLRISDFPQPSALAELLKQDRPSPEGNAPPSVRGTGIHTSSQQSSDPSTKYSTPTASTSTARPPVDRRNQSITSEAREEDRVYPSIKPHRREADENDGTTPRQKRNPLEAEDVFYALPQQQQQGRLSKSVAFTNPTAPSSGSAARPLPTLAIPPTNMKRKDSANNTYLLISPRQAMDTPRNLEKEGSVKTDKAEPKGGTTSMAANITPAQPHMNLFDSQ